MVGAVVVLVVLAIVVLVAVNLSLRAVVQEEARTEAHLHAPGTHTVALAIPPGVDPAQLRHELHRAGFASGVERLGDDECLLVECEPGQRDQVRAALRYPGGPGGTPLLERVVFQDEC